MRSMPQHVRMDRKTALQRFTRLEEGIDGRWMLLSKDLTLGYVLEPEWDKYISLGRYKIKERKRTVLQILDINIDTTLLFRAMRVFRRRYIVEFGVYVKNVWIPCIREDDNIILIAPVMRTSIVPTPLQDFVYMTEEDKQHVQDILKWKTILVGREKNGGG